MNRTVAIVVGVIIIIALGYFMFSQKSVSAEAGSVVTVHYVGTLENGTKFDASTDHGGPLRLSLGQGYVIPGWEEGLIGMKVGEKKRLVVPPAKAYGENGVPPVIPGNATLIFDVEMLKIEPAGPTPVAPVFVTAEVPSQQPAATTTAQ